MFDELTKSLSLPILNNKNSALTSLEQNRTICFISHSLNFYFYLKDQNERTQFWERHLGVNQLLPRKASRNVANRKVTVSDEQVTQRTLFRFSLGASFAASGTVRVVDVVGQVLAALV